MRAAVTLVREPPVPTEDAQCPDRLPPPLEGVVYIRPPSTLAVRVNGEADPGVVAEAVDDMLAKRPVWQRLLGVTGPIQARAHAPRDTATMIRELGMTALTARAARLTHLPPAEVLVAAYADGPDVREGAARRRYTRTLGLESVPVGLKALVADASVPPVLLTTCTLYHDHLAWLVARELVTRGLCPTLAAAGVAYHRVLLDEETPSDPDDPRTVDETAVHLGAHSVLALLGYAHGPDPRTATASGLALDRVAAVPDLVLATAWDVAVELVTRWCV